MSRDCVEGFYLFEKKKNIFSKQQINKSNAEERIILCVGDEEKKSNGLESIISNNVSEPSLSSLQEERQWLIESLTKRIQVILYFYICNLLTY